MKKIATYLPLILLTTLLFQTYLFAEDEPSIYSESGIIMDAKTGQILYQKSPHKQLNPASITKLLTALIVLDTLDPQDTLTFSQEAINSIDYTSSRIGMKIGETITVEDALHGLLLMSANEVANALAEKSSSSINNFIVIMNKKAKELWALDSNFENPHGLTDPNHLTSVYDMALITQEIIKNDYFLKIMKHTMYQIPATNKVDEIRYLSQQHKMLNNKSDMLIYREDVIAGKVGYTKESGHTLVTVAKQDDRTLILVIMQTNAANLYPDTSKLLDYGFNNFTKVELDASDLQTRIDIPVNKVYSGSILLSTNKPQDLLLPEGYTKDSLKYHYNLDSDLITYTSDEGDLGGTCDILIDDNIILNLPLYIKTINKELINIEDEVIEVIAITSETSIVPLPKEKNSLFPLLFIVLLFIVLTILCLPKKNN